MKYVCNVCGWVYDEEETGVKWEDLPDDFACELCGAGKEDCVYTALFLTKERNYGKIKKAWHNRKACAIMCNGIMETKL